MARFDPRTHHRRSTRLKGYETAQPGACFVTLVTQGRECLFGEVITGDMHLNPFGSLVENEWQRLACRFARVVVDEWIVMPNHIHGILVIVEDESNIDPSHVGARREESPPSVEPPMVGARRGESPPSVEPPMVGARRGESPPSVDPPVASPSSHPSGNIPIPSPMPGSLGAIIGAYKSTTTRLINGLRRTPGEPVWQRNFYEHIIRNDEAWRTLRAYIRKNPLEWELDSENPDRIEAAERATRLFQLAYNACGNSATRCMLVKP